ncbi:MAG: Hsp20/alpha crystallin family protein [Acidobacteria bacterium]|nr:Hsp20/alpha crystallin family protein [Acidobacteriota bacterium]
MKITIFPEVSFIQDELNNVFKRYLQASRSARKREVNYSPLVDCYENEEYLVFKIEVPGVKMEDLILEIRGNYLYIEGFKAQVQNTEPKRHLLVERSFGRFARYLPISKSIDYESALAIYKNGMLIVKFKIDTEEKPNVFKIKIQETDSNK